MTPERLRNWLRKRPPGATHVDLVLELPSGVGMALGSWPHKEISDALEPGSVQDDPADAIIAVAQDYADSTGDDAQTLVRWMNEARPMLTQRHTAKVSKEASEKSHEALLKAADPQVMIARLLDANLALVKQQQAALGTVCQAMERTLAAQNRQIELQTERMSKLEGIEQTQPMTDEEKEAQLAKAGTFNALTEAIKQKLPDSIDLVLNAAASRFIPPEQKQ